jgi:hypothetical protein
LGGGWLFQQVEQALGIALRERQSLLALDDSLSLPERGLNHELVERGSGQCGGAVQDLENLWRHARSDAFNRFGFGNGGG